MSPVNFLKHTIFPEVGQGAISYTLSYTRPVVFQDRCTESQGKCTGNCTLSYQEPCPVDPKCHIVI